MKDQSFIQVGFTATRDPGTGEFLPSMPLYIKATDQANEAANGLPEDLINIFAGKLGRFTNDRLTEAGYHEKVRQLFEKSNEPDKEQLKRLADDVKRYIDKFIDGKVTA